MTPAQIRQARIDSGLTQKECARLVGAALRTWQGWEEGSRKMRPIMFELFKFKLGQKNAAVSNKDDDAGAIANNNQRLRPPI